MVAIKYSVPREMYARLTRLAGDKILVSTASEEEWFDNIVELGWQLYLCSSPPYTLQTKVDRRMREYTDLAFAGEVARAKAVRDSLNPVREAFRRTRPPEKFHSHSKYWQELLGPGGRRGAPAAAGADRSREGSDAARVRDLRPEARSRALERGLAVSTAVMAGLVPAIHDLLAATKEDVDARNKCGHDAKMSA